MMHTVLAGLDQGEAVMPCVDVEEIGAERLFDVVGKPEAEHVDIERHHGGDDFDGEHGVAEAEWTGTETRNRTAGPERCVVDLGAVKRLEPVAGGVAARNQAPSPP